MSIDCPHNAGIFFDPVKKLYFVKCVHPEGPCPICKVRVPQTIPTEQCAGCPAIKICTRWSSSGTWDYTKGKNPCHPVPDNSDLVSNDSDRIPRDLFDLRDGR